MSDEHSRRPVADRPRRADAERSIARILAAAVDCLAADPEASMAEIARRAGVVRATIYVHFPTRESLIAAVTHEAVNDVARVIASAAPEEGEPAEALRRVLAAAWRTLGRYHALVAINTRTPSDELRGQHAAALDVLAPLIARGQATGAFRADVPASWHLAVVLALVHGASAELSAGRIASEQVETALVETVLGALAGGAAR